MYKKSTFDHRVSQYSIGLANSYGVLLFLSVINS